MIDSDERALLRELCERASKEYNPEKLIELVRRINELLDKKLDKTEKNSGSNDGQKLNSAYSHFAWQLSRVNHPYRALFPQENPRGARGSRKILAKEWRKNQSCKPNTVWLLG